MTCSTCDVDFPEIPSTAILLDDRNGIQIWKFPDGAGHVFHARQQAGRVEAVELAEAAEQPD